MLGSLQLPPWLLPVALGVAGIVAGLLAERLVRGVLLKAVRRSRWDWDELLVESLRGMVLTVCVAGGLYGTSLALPLGDRVAGIVHKTLLVVVFLAVTIVATRLSAGGVRLFASHRGGMPSSSLIENVVRILVFALGAFLILQNLGVQVTPLITGLGIGGLAVALALQDTLSNLFSGFQLILARQVRRGDYVQLETGHEGYVTDITWRNTTIRSWLDDHEVVVPNSKVANSIVTNYDFPGRPMWVRVDVGVSYTSDLERVEEVTLEVARQVLEEELGEPPEDDPVLRFHAFGDSSVDFTVRMRVDQFTSQFRVKHLFVKRLHARYAEEGINIPFPIRTLFAPDGVRVHRERGEAAD